VVGPARTPDEFKLTVGLGGGYTTNPDGDTINVYYGAADCAIALARTSVRSLLAWLDANGSCERRQRTEL